MGMFKIVIILIALIIICVHIKRRRLPGSLMEWIILVSAAVIVISNLVKYFHTVSAG